jgi:predicted secreted protein
MTADTFVKPVAGELLLLMIGTTVSGTTTYASSAAINTTRSLDLSAKASSTEVSDVTNPSAPAITVRQIQSTDLKFSGDGVADGPSMLSLINLHQNGQPFPCEIVQNTTGANGGWTAAGQLVITSLSLKGTARDMQTFSATFEADGAFTFTANA